MCNCGVNYLMRNDKQESYFCQKCGEVYAKKKDPNDYESKEYTDMKAQKMSMVESEAGYWNSFKTRRI